MKPCIVVHGGAGSWHSDLDRLAQAELACKSAVNTGQTILAAGGSALQAVEMAVRILEDSPVLDAGRGSYLNSAGQIEMDALIMDGATLDLGAVAAVQRVLHPITLARRVMEKSDHSFLVASGAEAFADSIGFPRCEITDLLVGKELEEYQALRQGSEVRRLSGPVQTGNTVGAVALDANRNLAGATSTGGTRRKYPGRIGDSPLVGSGAYADNQTAAVSATGYGESLMKIVISKQVSDYVAGGFSAQEACEAAIALLSDRVNGSGGLIAIDAGGRFGAAFNTEAMPWAYAAVDGTHDDDT